MHGKLEVPRSVTINVDKKCWKIMYTIVRMNKDDCNTKKNVTQKIT